MTEKQWQYGMNIVFGLLLFFLPWLLGFAAALPMRGWNFFVIGAAIVAFALLALHMRSQIGAWANLILGAWMIVSPWILGFSANVIARDAAIALGALVVLLSWWAKMELRQLQTRPAGRASGHV
ncbi:MAG: SPW repeat protein [Burkholderiales bacterium]